MTPQGIGAPGPRIPGFDWVRRLGSGGFADVHLYRQELPAREVAIKVVRSSADTAAIAELRREADFMTAVSGHPAILRLHGAGTTEDGRPYLVMEYCPVADIADQVRRRPLAIDRALDLMIRISAGVEMLHRAGIVHRDIKPANLMLDAYGSPVLADFGVASRVGALEEGMLDGFSVLWAPPEQQDSRARAHPSQDVWALATTTWTLLAGRSPFEDPLGDNSPLAVASRVRSGRVRALGRADAPPELEAVLREAMSVDPVARTRSAAEFGRALQGIQRLMGRPVTRLEVKDPDASGPATTMGPAPTAGGAAASADEGTRVRAAPSIDADRTRLRAPSYDFQDVAAPVPDSWAEPRSATTGRREEDAPEEPGRRGMRPWAIVLLALVAAVVAAALIVAMHQGAGRITRIGTPTGSTGGEASDPIGAPPDPVVALSGALKDGAVHWTWLDAEDAQSGAQSGDGTGAPSATHYVYTATRPGADDVVNSVTRNAVAISAIPGENCLEVSAVGDDGRQSVPVRACVEVPAP